MSSNFSSVQDLLLMFIYLNLGILWKDLSADIRRQSGIIRNFWKPAEDFPFQESIW